jgi:hypothetical protein
MPEMSQTQISEFLTQFDEEFENAQLPESGKSNRLPDGDWEARVSQSFVGVAPWDEVQWTIEFEAEVNGETKRITKWNSLQNKERMEWTKKDLFTLGYKGKLSQFNLHAHELLDSIVKINVKTTKRENKEFTNVYINELVAAPALVGSGNPQSDDVPF